MHLVGSRNNSQSMKRTVIGIDFHHGEEPLAADVLRGKMQRCDLNIREASIDLTHLRQLVGAVQKVSQECLMK
jgi:hypothetical protein